MERPLTYEDTGVRFKDMDPFKRKAQRAGRETAGNIQRISNGDFKAVESSRGESAYLIETPDSYLAHVEEGLGTKNLVADAMRRLTGTSYHDQLAQCAMAMIANDLITLGALPLSVAMHLGVGDSRWFEDEDRVEDLVNGWKHACDLARCVWGGGETPTLKGDIVPGSIVLSGSAMGVIKPKSRRISGNIKDGDAIIFAESSGIHANGLTLARSIAERKDGFFRRLGHSLSPQRFPLRALPEGYLTPLNDGRTYGETLLDPTHIYVSLVEKCLDLGIDVHYVVNITGHGWRKLMRSWQPFAYVIDEMPNCPPIFDFIQKHGPVDDREAYGNFNMGAGLALYVAERDVAAVLAAAEAVAPVNLVNYYRTFKAGYIEQSEAKRVVIKPKNLQYAAETLAVR